MKFAPFNVFPSTAGKRAHQRIAITADNPDGPTDTAVESTTPSSQENSADTTTSVVTDPVAKPVPDVVEPTPITGGPSSGQRAHRDRKLQLFNFAVAIAIATTASWRSANDSTVGTAIAAFWLVWFSI